MSGTLGDAVLRPQIAATLMTVSALLLAGPANAQPTTLFPGTTYEQSVQFTSHGPVTIHIVRGPKPSGLYRLRPVLSNESVLGEERLSSMQRRLATQATMVGVNGDFSRIADGKPSGILLRDGVLVTPPNGQRSSVGVALDGTLDIRRVKFRGTWRGAGQRRAINSFNDSPTTNGVSLFTSEWGPTTPRVSGSYSVVLSPFPPSVPNTELVAPVTSVARNARVRIPPGSAVLIARGNAAARLEAEAPVGTTVTLRLILQPDWATVTDAVGGGPVLVRDGRPVYRANEAFSVDQIAPRHPRTAVGQLRDGRILFVVVDGRQPGYSIGMTTFEMALTMTRLGAVRAMQLDGGGSSTIAFDGHVFNSPSDGRERPVTTALMLQYYGVFAPPPAEDVVSPNGDGVAERQELSYKVVRQSDVTVTLTAPDGGAIFRETAQRAPGSYAVPFPPAPTPPPQPGQPRARQAQGVPAEGRWTLAVTATDDQGLPSSSVRRFSVNSTVGFLKTQPSRLTLPPNGRANASIRWTQTRAARVRVSVETPEGVLIRVPAIRRFEAGEQSATWNGRLASGKRAPSGRYIVAVEATNELGSVRLEDHLSVRRLAPRRR